MARNENTKPVKANDQLFQVEEPRVILELYELLFVFIVLIQFLCKFEILDRRD